MCFGMALCGVVLGEEPCQGMVLPTRVFLGLLNEGEFDLEGLINAVLRRRK